VKLAIEEIGTSGARALWREFAARGTELFAPTLILYEFVSVVWQRQRRHLLSSDEAPLVLQMLMSLPVTVVGSGELHRDAYLISAEFDLPSSYDAHYLALALQLDCEFWTADERLFKAASPAFGGIRLLGAA
jgi:predicted nucleic acid-binding protein